MNLASKLIGADAGREYLLRASTDAIVEDLECQTASQLWITQDLDGDGQIGEENLCLYFDFLDPNDPPLSHPNAFEGTVEMPWQRHYAVWPSFNASTGCRLLLLLLTPDPTVEWPGAKQYWMLTQGNNIVHIHPTEVPGPTCP